MNPIGLSVACCLALAITRADDAVRAIFARLDAIIPRPVDIEREIRRINFDGVVSVQTANADIQRSRCKLNLNGVVVEIQERATGIFA
jgi:hypothetical protein